MERDPSVQLHGAYLLEELGAMILQYTTNTDTKAPNMDVAEVGLVQTETETEPETERVVEGTTDSFISSILSICCISENMFSQSL